MPEVFSLPAALDLRSAGSLKSELLARRGQELALDASGVERIGGLGLQVLLSARKTWAADSQRLELRSPSEAFTEQWRAFGAPAFETAEAGERP
jgi:chemotaxis protein CheX